MKVAFDIQPDPVPVLKPASPSLLPAITGFYALTVVMLGLIGAMTAQRIGLEKRRQVIAAERIESGARRDALLAELRGLEKRASISDDLIEWLSICPPAQSLILLLSRDVEPSVAFSKLSMELEPGSPNAKITVEFSASNQDISTKQVANIQAALIKSGFRTVNIEADAPTPEGWRFVTLVALPLKGDFAQVNQNTRS